MSKLFKFYEYLNLIRATQYLSYLLKESVTEDILVELINDKKIVGYFLDYAFLTPITLNKDETEIERLNFNHLENNLLYLYIPYGISGVFSFEEIDSSCTGCNAYLIEHEEHSYTLTTLNDESRGKVYPVKSYIYDEDNKKEIYLKTKDIQQLAVDAKSNKKNLSTYTYHNIEIIYDGLNGKPMELTFINQNQMVSKTNQQLIEEIKGKALHTKERESIHKLIATLLDYANLNLPENYKIANGLVAHAKNSRIEELSEDTIVKYIKGAKNYLPDPICPNSDESGPN